MKKISKLVLSFASIAATTSIIAPIVVSCSEYHDVHQRYWITNKDVQKVMFGDKELKKEQNNFSFEVWKDTNNNNVFTLHDYLDTQLNYYDSSYDGILNQDEDVCSTKSNTFLIPSRIMYKNEWYDLEYIDKELFKNMHKKYMSVKLKSLRFDPLINKVSGPITIDAKGFDNIVDVQNAPLTSFKENNRPQASFNILISEKVESLRVTYNTNISSHNNKYALPRVASNNLVILKDFTFPKKVNTILERDFNGIRYTNNFPNIPENIEYIEGDAFNKTFKSSYIPNRFYKNTIPKQFFKNMTIDKIDFSGVNKIDEKAFENADFTKSGNLQQAEFKIPEGVTTIEKAAFESAKINKIYLPDSLVSLGNPQFSPEFPFYTSKLVEIVVKSERVKNLILECASSIGYDVPTITIDPNWDQKI